MRPEIKPATIRRGDMSLRATGGLPMYASIPCFECGSSYIEQLPHGYDEAIRDTLIFCAKCGRLRTELQSRSYKEEA